MIGLGTAQFGMNYGVANTSGRTPDNEAFEILDYAKKLKINTLDTAKAYGESEDVLGKYFLNANEKGWNVVTKVSSNYGNVVNQIEQSYKKITKYHQLTRQHQSKECQLLLTFSDTWRGFRMAPMQPLIRQDTAVFKISDVRCVTVPTFSYC